MSIFRFLITGATGATGGGATAQLLKQGKSAPSAFVAKHRDAFA
jgi:uncharacterized protein YbjT (DUF2867 family)